MKKIIKELIFIAVFTLFPGIVFAAGDITASPRSLSIEVGKTDSFTISAINTFGYVSIASNNTSIATVSANEWETGMVDSGQTKTGSITVTGVSAGSAIITITVDDATTYDEESLTGKTITINVTVTPPKSSNNNLSNLTINGTTIAGFSAGKTSYTYEADATTINIGGTVEDVGKANIISGLGNQTLDYNAKNITITVRAENGSTKNYVISAKRTDNRSKDNYLSNLTTNPSLFNFNRNTRDYPATVENNVNSITINATPSDSKSTVTINGTTGNSRTVSLNNYRNNISVVVRAENGETRTYTLRITRKDEEGRTASPEETAANDSSLSSLNVENYSISFNPDVLEYELSVTSDIEKVNIVATPTNPSATIEGGGEISLNPGENEVTIKVSLASGETTEYKLKITRSDKSSIPSTLLTSLSYNGREINVNTDERTFLIGIESTIDKLDLQYKTSSASSKFDVDGNTGLSEGINIITIKVTDDGEDDTTYTLIVNKLNSKLTDSLAIDEFTGNTTFQTKNQVKIKKSLIDTLSKTDYKFTYNFVNEYDGLLYGVQFDKNVSISEDIELTLNKIGSYEKSVVYSSNIPKGATVRLHVDEKLKDKKVYLYSYNLETKKYILIKSNEKIENEYINFESDGSYIYFISEKKITDHNFIFQIILYLLFFVLGALIMLTIYVFMKKRKLKLGSK